MTAAAIPWDSRVQQNLGSAYLERGELDAARAAFERALAIDPGSTGALGNLGAIQIRAGEYEGARATDQHMLQLEPGSSIAWNYLGLAEAHMLMHTSAIERCEQAIRLNPNYGPAHDNLRESRRIVAEASRFLEQERAAAERGGDPRLLRNLSAACTVVGDAACAASYAERAAHAEAR